MHYVNIYAAKITAILTMKGKGYFCHKIDISAMYGSPTIILRLDDTLHSGNRYLADNSTELFK